jgi:hypothetical protein
LESHFMKKLLAIALCILGCQDLATDEDEDADSASDAELQSPSAYVPLTSARLLDTRPGYSTIDGKFLGLGLRPAGTTTAFTVVNRGGIRANADSVVLTITVTDPAANGSLTVFPCGTPRPTTTNLSWVQLEPDLGS